jgi:hypothetical protein
MDIGKPRTMHMKANDMFTAEMKQLLDDVEPMEWEDDETILFAYSGPHEMMDDEHLELPMDPAHEFRELKALELVELSCKAEEERVRLYGTDPRIMDMLCTENFADIHRCLWRMERGDELHKQIRTMNELRENGSYYDAHKIGVWLLSQNERYGVGYNKELLRILKETVVALSDEVRLFDAECVHGNHTTK